MTVIPERDVYRLAMNSKLPSAEEFEEWVVAEVSTALNPPVALSHPTHLRQWHRENQKTAELPGELQDLTIESKPAVTLDTRSAERIAKVINRANAGGEGSDIAKKHVEGIAKKRQSLRLKTGLLKIIPER